MVDGSQLALLLEKLELGWCLQRCSHDCLVEWWGHSNHHYKLLWFPTPYCALWKMLHYHLSMGEVL